jgi:hypothetical protein
VDAARNFLAVIHVGTLCLSSLSTESKIFKTKFSTYAEAALSTLMASDEPTEEQRFSTSEVKRAAKNARLGVLTILRDMPTWAA